MVARSWTSKETQFSRLFGRNVKRVRLHIGWHQEKLAEELQSMRSFFDASQISCIERGWYSNRQRVRVNVDDLMSFVSVLGIPPRVMLSPMEEWKWWRVITSNPYPIPKHASRKHYTDKIAEHFKKCRESNEMTQIQLAEKLSGLGLQISRNQLSRVESGLVSRGMSVDHLMYFAMALCEEAPEITVERWLLET
jgi:transcriptional regulator with XRE-family HTH domain